MRAMALTRRGFLASGAAAVGLRGVGVTLTRKPRVVLELVYDKGLGMMRAVERIVR